MGHRTGIGVIRNSTSQRHNIVQNEWGRLTFAQGPGQSRSWENQVPLPWCADPAEIRAKGLLFFFGELVGGVPQFYMFQDPSEVGFWTPYNGGLPSYEGKRFAGAGKSSLIDLEMLPDLTPKATRVLQ